MLRRLIVVSFGFVVAAAAGMTFLPIALLFDSAARDWDLATTMADLFAMAIDALDNDAYGDAFAASVFVLWATGVATCAAPLAVAALIGEAAGVRSYTWYAGASAALAAASPWIIRAARHGAHANASGVVENRVVLLFFLSGALTGSIYWLITARDAEPPARDGEETRDMRG